MWWSDDYVEFLRGGAALLAFLVFVSPVRKVNGATDFKVYRLQQYQIHGYSYGSGSSLVNVEASTLSDNGHVLRQCIIAKLADVTPSVYQQLADGGASAMLIILPSNMTSLSPPALQLAKELEQSMLTTEVTMSVFFTHESQEIRDIYAAVKSRTATAAKSAAANFLSSLASDGYQMVVTGSQAIPIQEMSIANIYGKLSGYGADDKQPTISIVSHYDSFGAAPELSFGGNSNAGGAASLLEVSRILSRFYRAQYTHPTTNVLFLLSGGGYLNYQGSKRFLEDQLDGSDTSLLGGDGQPQFVLCLDTLTASDALYLHVSKPPKENTLLHSFYQTLVEVASEFGVKVELVHRKINLQDDRQPWEHHKYSIRRLSAATLSALPSPDAAVRGSMFDTEDSISMDRLVLHTKVLTSALLRHIYATTASHQLSSLPPTLDVSSSSLSSWVSMLCSQARSSQLLQPAKTNPIIRNLHSLLDRYTSEAKVSVYKPDKRDPEYGFHDMTGGVMTAYAIKPITFDFILTIFIAGYMGAVYLFLQQMPLLYKLLVPVTPVSNGKIKSKVY